MSRVEDIDTGIWSDPDFMALSPVARSVYIWSWTNAHCGMSGIYKIDRRLIGFETGWTEDELTEALVELERHEMLFYDGRVMYVKARAKRLRSKSPNIAKSILRDLENVGVEHPYVIAFRARYGHGGWLVETLREGLRNLSEPFPKGLDPSQGVQGKGKGKGNKGGAGGTDDPELLAEFHELLAFHERTTGMTPPREGTKARQDILEHYGARRSEGYTVEDVRCAVTGAWNDEYRRGHGYVGLDSILRPTKIHSLIERGRATGGRHLTSVTQSTDTMLAALNRRAGIDGEDPAA